MQALADRTGGKVIEPTQTTPIEFDWPTQSVSLTPVLAMFGASAIAFGLIIWKVR